MDLHNNKIGHELGRRAFEYYVFIIPILLVSCSDRCEYENIENYLSKISPETEITFDSLTRNPWNSLYILKPYSYNEIEEYNIQIPKKYQKNFKSEASFDNSCILIFVRDNKMTGFAKIPRSTADFSYLKQNQYPKGQKFYINDKRIVTVIKE